jgi:DNA-binding response OmpR family regulator
MQRLQFVAWRVLSSIPDDPKPVQSNHDHHLKLHNAQMPVRAHRILLVEEDEVFRVLLSRFLASDGIEVIPATDGEEAWDELRRNPCDLLVTDNEMPRLAGLDLIERVRQAGMRLPIILTSGSLAGETTQDYLHLNIAAMVPKPFNPWEFAEFVRQVLGLPVEDASVANRIPANSSALPPAAPTKHVLIADDDALVRGSLAAVLECEGFAVEEASDGLEAVTRAIAHQPDLVLLDLNMPHADGWTAFRQLAQVKPLLPVIIITARPNQSREAVRVGVDAFMEKPLNISILVKAVKRLTNENEPRQGNRSPQRPFVTQLLGILNA